MVQKLLKPEQWLSYCILAISLVIVGIGYSIYQSQNQEIARAQFEQQANKIQQSVLERIEKYETILEAGKALFAASEDVNHQEWEDFAQSMDIIHRYPGMVSFGYVSYVPQNQRESFLKKAEQSFPNFNLWPQGERAEYLPIYYIEPLTGNEMARGFDISTEPKRYHAALRSRDEGSAQITEKIILVQTKEQNSPAFLMLTPIYRNKIPHSTLQEKRENLQGWVYGAFQVEGLMRGVLPSHDPLFDVEIFDGETIAQDKLLYDDDKNLHAIDANHHPMFDKKIKLKITGNSWTLYITTLPAFNDFTASNKPMFFLLGGLLCSFLLFFLLMNLLNTQKMANKLAKKMTYELDKSNRFKNAILDSANYSIISCQLNGMIQSFNKEAEQSLGYSADEVIGKYTPAIIHDPKEVEQRAQELSLELGRVVEPGFDVFVEKCKQGQPEEREWTYVRKDGTRFPILLSVTAIRDENGNITSYLGVASNITERKKVEKMKNEFISTVSHELRTPLTSIRGALGLVIGGLAGEISEKTKPLIKIALNNCERLVRLINDILDIEKIESGKMQFHPKVVNMNDLVKQSMEANMEYVAAFNVKLSFDATDENQFAYVDPDRILQVLTNLISNAVKFSPPHESVSIQVITMEGNIVRVQISDKGPGIPENFRKQIFNKFMQADSSDTRKKGGTGLGLSISKSIIERSGGNIGFESEQGKGSKFYFEFPAQIKLESLQSMLHNLQVLVCENEPNIAQDLKTQLEASGCKVDIVQNAEAARLKLKSQTYDAMTLDVLLPHNDGLCLLRELRENPKTAQLPVLIISAKPSSEKDQWNGNITNIIDWMEKPFNDTRLRNAVDKIKRFHSGKPLKILHVEDDPDTSALIAKLLEDIAEVDPAYSLEEAMRKIQAQRYHLIILDIGLPDGSGTEILNIPGRTSKGLTPILVFSALDIDAITTQRVSSVLMKSKTSNEEFIHTVKSLLALYSKEKKETSS